MMFRNPLFFLFIFNFATAQSPEFIEKTPTDLGLYIVKTAEGTMGVVDEQGQFIIPLDSVALRQWFPPESSFFISSRNPGQNFQQSLFDSTGNTLFSNARIRYVGLGVYYPKGDNSHRDYFIVEQKGKPNKLLFHKKSGQILPDSFSQIDYGGANSTFITQSLGENGTPKMVSVFGLDGKKRFTIPPEIRVTHSGSPNILLATQSNSRKKGLIFVDKGLDSTVYEFDALRKMWTGWFVYSKDERKHFGLIAPDGKPSGKADFIKLGEPNRAELEIFSAQTGSSPIATGVRSGMEKPTWIGIDSLGAEYVFTEAAPAETIGQYQERLRIEQAGKARPELPDGSELSTPPAFPGGLKALDQFIESNLRYPKIAQENGIAGTVILQMDIEADGRLSNIFVKRDIGNGCGLAAVQCFEKMPRWSPASHDGKAVACSITIPVEFKLKN
jgi:TonB family protein